MKLLSPSFGPHFGPRFGPRRGQVVILVILGMSIFLIGALGLAIDGSQMYAHRQMAQTAADAAVQAGIMSIMDGTNLTGAYPFGVGAAPVASFVCNHPDLRTPCVYAQNNGFGSAADTVTVSFPTAVSGVTLSSGTVPAMTVTVQRTLNTGLIRFVGVPATTSISAKATAGLVGIVTSLPLLITHPTYPRVLSSGGVTICGGPSRGVQVNSNSATASSGADVDLSHAGPDDQGNCSSGTGSDFGSVGGPTSKPGGMALGSMGNYVQPASPVPDPYANIPAPAQPAAAPAKTSLANGVGGCPAAAKKSCNLYSPGLYSSGISVKNETAVFKPGLYYVSSGGFGNSANGEMVMATGFPSDPATGAGMVVFNTGSGTFDSGANSSATLTGSDYGSTYRGILFFEDRTAPAQTHNLGGGGDISLTGVIYLTNSLAIMTTTPTQFQTLSLGGNSSIQINGTIVVGKLSTNGAASIQFNLSAVKLPGRAVALVQ